MKAALLVPSLTGGGAERVAATLASGFAAAGHQVTVITTTSRPDFFDLPPGVTRVRLDLTGAKPGEALNWRNAVRTIGRLPRALRQLRTAVDDEAPDVVVAFMEHLNVLALSTIGGSRPVVITEHINPRRQRLGRIWRLLRRALYPRAACLVSVSEGVDEAFSWLPATRRRVIHNPLPREVSSERPASTSTSDDPPVFCAMGRLDRQKGFDLLLEAFSDISDKHPDWGLVIIGEGEERPVLERQVHDYGLEDRVTMPGAQADPFDTLSRSEFFVLSSRWEGFGNVLAEALACGLPVISFDCPSGPAEIVEHDRNGWLVAAEDTRALAEAIDEMMANSETRSAMASVARASVEHLRLTAIVERWESEVFPLVSDPTSSPRSETR